jgi:V8-like Glu-specific endopeptidase
MSDRLDNYDRYKRAFDQRSIEQVWTARRAIVGAKNMPPGEQPDLAKAALDALDRKKLPTPKQLAALELMVRLMRPSVLSISGLLEDLPDEAAALGDWNGFREAIRPSLYTIGRVDNATGEGIGSGFLASPRLFVTNTHVLEMLSNGTRLLERGQATIRLRHEYDSKDEPPIDVVKVVAVHPKLDMTILEVDPVPLGADRVLLSFAENDAVKGNAVVVLGYPLDDSDRNPLFVSSIFEGRFAVKRAAPGEVIDTTADQLFHDCSTLGGNSGSPVICLRSCKIVGIHQSGDFMFRNESVQRHHLWSFVQDHL